VSTVKADAVRREGPRLRRPPEGRPVPVSTYRLQLNADFTLDDAAARVPYLSRLGVTHLYLSPILEAAPGSTHGYDVVDHASVSTAMGGEEALERLTAAAREAGLGLVLDLVPNHVAVPVPAWHNRALWSVLAEGPESPYADWFDVDWSSGLQASEDGAMLMPVLGNRIGEVLAAGEIVVGTETVPGEGERPVLRYYDHVLPVRAGTENLPLAELLERQHYRLAWWKVAAEELNYRRFFDVDTLAAIRVEIPKVFDATHALVVDLVRRGIVDGLRIDHPDGLAAPKAYLERLAEQTDHSWVVVEKILAPDEELPEDWATAGTTGYDAMWRVHAAFVDSSGESELASVMRHLTGDDTLHTLVETAKREVLEHSLQAEVQRLATLAASLCHDDIRLRDHTAHALRDCLVELLVESERYRYYLVPGETMEPRVQAAFEACVERARLRLADDRHATLDVLAALLQGHEVGSAGRTDEPRRAELIVRFQQTCGPVMAKAVEDTTFYRWTHLIGLNEVGGAPERFAISPEELHAFAARALDHAPLAMSGLSTHDTKRSEDVRMRLNVLAECAPDWAAHVARLREATAELRSPLVDGRTENFLWQTLAGIWTGSVGGARADAPRAAPEDASGTTSGGSGLFGGDPAALERLEGYLVKAMREAKTHTTWTEPDADYEQAVLALARGAVEHEAVVAAHRDWLALTEEAVRAATLGIKLVQLTLPGVADVYQGSEAPIVALVDPDNRRPVDFDTLERRLAALDEEAQPRDLADEKLLVTSRALRARRDHAEAFVGVGAGYRSLPASTGNAFTFARTVGDEARVVVVATRLALSLARYGGWQEHTVTLPTSSSGGWVCALSGRAFEAGETRLDELLATLPVALLVADGEPERGLDTKGTVTDEGGLST